MQRGLAAYQSQQFEAARDSFQQLLEERGHDPHVLHNLALTYVQLKEPPRAIALWRKALAVAHEYQPARQGIEFIEKDINLKALERDQMSLWARESLERVSVIELSWFLALMLAAAGYFWIRFLVERTAATEQEKPLPPFPTSAILASLFLAFSVLLMVSKLNQIMTTRATVVVSKVNARSLPSEDGVSVFEVRGGNEVWVRRQNNDWVQVVNSEGNSGWVKNAEILITSGN